MTSCIIRCKVWGTGDGASLARRWAFGSTVPGRLRHDSSTRAARVGAPVWKITRHNVRFSISGKVHLEGGLRWGEPRRGN